MEIQKTTDYALFKKLRGNRNENQEHIRRLKQSMSQNPDGNSYQPILVNDKMEVIDGQHRIEALKQLRLPVYYVQATGLGLQEVQALNATRRAWKPIDYARSYAELGNEHYQRYMVLAGEYPTVSHGTLMYALAGSQKGGRGRGEQLFNTGKFKAGKTELEATTFMNHLIAIQERYGGWDRSSFSNAYYRLHAHPDYKHEQFQEQLRQYGYTLVKYPSWKEALEALQTMYNQGRPATERIKAFEQPEK